MGVKEIVEAFKKNHQPLPALGSSLGTNKTKTNFAGCRVPHGALGAKMQDLGISTAQLAARVGLSRSYMAKIIKSPTAPWPWIQQRIAIALECSPANLWPCKHPKHEKSTGAFSHLTSKIHAKGLSIPQAAAAINITPKGLYKIIRGQTIAPRQSTKDGLCILLGITEDQLTGGE